MKTTAGLSPFSFSVRPSYPFDGSRTRASRVELDWYFCAKTNPHCIPGVRVLRLPSEARSSAKNSSRRELSVYRASARTSICWHLPKTVAPSFNTRSCKNKQQQQHTLILLKVLSVHRFLERLRTDELLSSLGACLCLLADRVSFFAKGLSCLIITQTIHNGTTRYGA